MKNPTVILLLSATLLFNLQSGYGQQEIQPSPKYGHSIGIAAGFITSHGFSYRFQANRFGIQTTFSPYADVANLNLFPGLAFSYVIVDNKMFDLLVYQGTRDNIHYYRSGSGNVGDDWSHTFNTGLGLGVRLNLSDRMDMDWMLGYAAYENFDRISITVDWGFFYRLNN